jgi:chromosome partitioning protein
MSARILAIANQKGGVAKTTTAVNLAAYLSAAGRRVLLVDMDAQANATTCLGLDPRTLRAGAYQLLMGEATAEQIVQRTAHSGLDILPATTDLAGAEVELTQTAGRERLLARGLALVSDEYDYILVDDPPSLGLLTINGLTAATHGVLIPVQCEYLALEGLSQLLGTVQRVRDAINPRLHVAGVVLTMYDSRTNLGQQVVQEVRTYFPQESFRTIIPRNIRLSEAPSYGQSIMAYAPNSAGALAYQALASEFINRLERPTGDGLPESARARGDGHAAPLAAPNLESSRP